MKLLGNDLLADPFKHTAVSCTRMHCIDSSDDLNYLKRMKSKLSSGLKIFLTYMYQ